MFCGQCGKEIEEGSRFCKFCGRPVILTQKNGPEAPEGPAPNAGYTDQTEQYTGGGRFGGEGTVKYEDRTGYTEQYAGGGRPGGEETAKYRDHTGYTEQYTGGGRPGGEGTAKYGDRTGYTEQYTGGGQIPAGAPPVSERRDYTRKFSSQNGTGPSPGESPENGFQNRQANQGENYIPPAGLRKTKPKTNVNTLTILLGVIAAVLFVTLGFLVYRIFLENPVSDGGKNSTSSAVKEQGSAVDSKSSEKGSDSGNSGTGQAESVADSRGQTGFLAVEKKANAAAYPGTMDVVSTDVTDYPNVKLYCSLTDSSGEGIVLQSPTAGIRETISGGEDLH